MEILETIKKQISDIIDKDYVKRDFIISHIDAMIEHRLQYQLDDNDFGRGYIAGLETIKDQIENLYHPPVF